ncbi:MAG: iron chelate uptake ABC transporter family permease subunit [Bacteroidota bacterium]
MDSFIDFFSFSDPNIRYVVIGSILLTASSATVGSFTFLKKKALVGDAVAHAVLPGVCLAFILSGNKNPFLLILGAFTTGWLSLVAIDWITRKSKIKEDSAIGLVLSVSFGIGILLLTMIQHSGNASQTGLDQFLFGKAASLVGSDLIVFTIVSLLLIFTIVLFFKELTLLAFDKAFAETIGFPVKRLELLLTTLTVMAVVVGIQAVGVVLMAAMLITPAAAARFWTERIKVMILLAALFGSFSGVTGAYISYIAPSMPTGPWIVMVISGIAFFSFFFAPGKGIVSRLFQQYRIRSKMNDENVLKALYGLGEKEDDFYVARSPEEINSHRSFENSNLIQTLKRLRSQGYLESDQHDYWLTQEGMKKGQRVVKLHRLWETYLTKYLRIAPDHVHEDAESIEHVLTPELEKRLEQLLEYPEIDPHQSTIPYNN